MKGSIAIQPGGTIARAIYLICNTLPNTQHSMYNNHMSFIYSTYNIRYLIYKMRHLLKDYANRVLLIDSIALASVPSWVE